MEAPRWTLDELAERVDAALAVDYRGQPSGRVRAVPDRRAIRWYTTIGLIDRPVAHRGRTALYGPRHLLQLVAVKRLQAKGLPLVAIQQELAGATDTQLAEVARLPAGQVPLAIAADGGGPSGPAGPGSRMAAPLDRAAGRPPAATPPPAATGPAPATRPPAAARPAAGAPRSAGGGARRATFWRQRPAAFTASTFEAGGGDATEPADAAGRTTVIDPTTPAGPIDAGGLTARTDSTDPALVDDRSAGAATLRGVRLGAGATLLLEPGRELDAADVQAIVDAAGPLLAALRDRGLDRGTGMKGRASGPRRAGRAQPRREHP